MGSLIPNSTSLPSYRKPPVNEVVCGMRFLPPDKLKIPYVGLLWEKFRADYPIVQHAVPIATAKGELLVDDSTGAPIPRVWFVNQAEDQLVQFQFDRFYYNWRRKQDAYPRYPRVIENFTSTVHIIQSFFLANDFGELNPIEYELSYINHITRGEGWDTIDDLHKVFKDFLWSRLATRFLPNPKSINWTAVFPIQEKMGSLKVSLKHATRTEDKVPVMVLEFAARVAEDSMDNEDFRKWFDVAHEWIVKGFTDLTTSEAHQFWEIEK